MALPIISTIDLGALTLEQLVATVRVLDEAGIENLKGVSLAKAMSLLTSRLGEFQERACDTEALGAAYDDVTEFLFDSPGGIPKNEVIPDAVAASKSKADSEALAAEVIAILDENKVIPLDDLLTGSAS